MLKHSFYKTTKVASWGAFIKFIVHVILCRVLFSDIKNSKLLISNISFSISENIHKK